MTLLTLLLTALSMCAVGVVASSTDDKPNPPEPPKPPDGGGGGADDDDDEPAPAGDPRKQARWSDEDLERKIQHRLRKEREARESLEQRLKAAEPALKKLAELEEAGKTETDKLREQLAAAQAEVKTAQDEAKAALERSESRYRSRVIGEAILETAGKMKLEGKGILKRDLLATGQLRVDTDDEGKEEVYAEDAAGRRISVQAFIEGYLKALGEEDVFTPRTSGGSGGRGGTLPRGGVDTSKMTPAEKISLGYKQAEGKA